MTDEETKVKDEEEVELIPDEEGELPDLQQKIKKVKKALARCEIEKKEYLDGWQRAKAEHINYKKDEGKRMEDIARFLAGGLIQEILPVLDSFDLALGHSLPPETEKGVLLIKSQLEDILRKRGLEEIKVAPGDDFNPEKHEALGEIESKMPSGKIAEVVQRGYTLQGRVLRPVRVRLSKGAG